MSMPRDVAALLRALALHRLRIAPSVRRQQARWAEIAAAIPDPGRRQAALVGLREKGRNAEATGVFVLLAPRSRRARTLAAITALQTAIDYLDALDEQGAVDLERSLALQGRLLGAVSAEPAKREWVSIGDDPYLDALLGACATHLGTLPGAGTVRPALVEAVRRCGEGQARTHAAAPARAADVRGLRAWAEALAEGNGALPGYLWWELAAGASSSVGAQALIAAAADPRTDAAEAAAIGAAYFPSVGALTVLLDDLADRDADAAAGEHSYLAYCADPVFAATRLGLLADRAAVAIAPLRRRPTHAAILAGVVAFYLGDPHACTPEARPIRDRLLTSTGAPARLTVRALSGTQ